MRKVNLIELKDRDQKEKIDLHGTLTAPNLWKTSFRSSHKRMSLSSWENAVHLFTLVTFSLLPWQTLSGDWSLIASCIYSALLSSEMISLQFFLAVFKILFLLFTILWETICSLFSAILQVSFWAPSALSSETFSISLTIWSLQSKSLSSLQKPPLLATGSTLPPFFTGFPVDFLFSENAIIKPLG